MTELSTPAGEAFAAYIEGSMVSDNPYPRGTAEYEEWLLTFANELENAVIGNELTIKSLMEQMG